MSLTQYSDRKRNQLMMVMRRTRKTMTMMIFFQKMSYKQYTRLSGMYPFDVQSPWIQHPWESWYIILLKRPMSIVQGSRTHAKRSPWDAELWQMSEHLQTFFLFLAHLKKIIVSVTLLAIWLVVNYSVETPGRSEKLAVVVSALGCLMFISHKSVSFNICPL